MLTVSGTDGIATVLLAVPLLCRVMVPVTENALQRTVHLTRKTALGRLSMLEIRLEVTGPVRILPILPIHSLTYLVTCHSLWLASTY